MFRWSWQHPTADSDDDGTSHPVCAPPQSVVWLGQPRHFAFDHRRSIRAWVLCYVYHHLGLKRRDASSTLCICQGFGAGTSQAMSRSVSSCESWRAALLCLRLSAALCRCKGPIAGLAAPRQQQLLLNELWKALEEGSRPHLKALNVSLALFD